MWSLSKNLELLCYPLGAIWFLLLAGTLSFLWKRKLGAAIFLFLIALLITVIGSTPLGAAALASLERPYTTSAAGDDYDAVIVLGGLVSRSAHEPLGFDVGESVDRLLTGMELVRRRKSAALVLGGGYFEPSPQSRPGAPRNEGEAMAHLARLWELPTTNIIALPPSANTHDEAVHFAHLAAERKWRKVALVTSAWHLRRAEAVFKKAGVSVASVGCDFRGLSELGKPPQALVPRTESFLLLQLFIREQIGYRVYAWRGWL